MQWCVFLSLYIIEILYMPWWSWLLILYRRKINTMNYYHYSGCYFSALQNFHHYFVSIIHFYCEICEIRKVYYFLPIKFSQYTRNMDRTFNYLRGLNQWPLRPNHFFFIKKLCSCGDSTVQVYVSSWEGTYLYKWMNSHLKKKLFVPI
jgi:hypothetical protein